MRVAFLVLILFFSLPSVAQVDVYDSLHYIGTLDKTTDEMSYKRMDVGYHRTFPGDFALKYTSLPSHAKTYHTDSIVDDTVSVQFFIPDENGIVFFSSRNGSNPDNIAGILFEPSLVKALVNFHTYTTWYQCVLNGDTVWTDMPYSYPLVTYREEEEKAWYRMSRFHQSLGIYHAASSMNENGGMARIMILDYPDRITRIKYINPEHVPLDFQCSGLNTGFYFDKIKQAYHFHIATANPGYSFQGDWDGEHMEYSESGDILDYILYGNTKTGERKIKHIESPYEVYERERKEVKEEGKPEPKPKPVPFKVGDDLVYNLCDKMPEFVGGEQKLFDYMHEHLVYPIEAKSTGIEGLVYISFVVMTDGSIKHVSLLRGIGGGCDEAAMDLARNFPNWIPGEQDGQKVNIKFNLPIRFKL